MNAPETMKPATQPISLAHKVLLKADDALCAEEIACAILGVDKPSKIDIKSVTKQLKQLADLGMIEVEERAGGVPFYRLIAAPVAESAESGRADIPTKTYPPAVIEAMVAELSGDSEGGETDAPAARIPAPEYDPASVAFPADFASDPALQYLAPEDYEMPPADPKLLAMANRALHDQAEELRAQLSSIAMIAAAYLPDPSDISTARAVEIMDMLADAQTGHILAQESALETRIQAWVKERGDISHVLEEIVFEPFTTSLLDHAKTAANAFSALSAKHETLKHQITELRTRAAEQAAQYQADIARISSGLAAERQAMNNAINEADRLRAELATARVLIKAMQEHGNVKDVAVGYLVRVPKRAPVLRRKPESARAAALSAVRAGAARAEVMAVVPVGTARRGAEWSPK